MSLFLQIRADSQGYLLDTRHIIRVLPLLRIEPVPLTSGGTRGVINYQGTPVPVLDLCQILIQRPAVPHFSTRLVLLSTENPPAPSLPSSQGSVALVAEGVSDVLRLEPGDFVRSPVTGSAVGLGPMANVAGSLLHRLELEELLRAANLASLENESSAAS